MANLTTKNKIDISYSSIIFILTALAICVAGELIKINTYIFNALIVIILLMMAAYHFFMCKQLKLNKHFWYITLAILFCAISEFLKIPLGLAKANGGFAFVPFFLTHVSILIYLLKNTKITKTQCFSYIPFFIMGALFITNFIIQYQQDIKDGLVAGDDKAFQIILQIFVTLYVNLLLFVLWRMTITILANKDLFFFFFGYVLFVVSDLIVIPTSLLPSVGCLPIIHNYIFATYISANFLFSITGTSTFGFTPWKK